MHINFSLAITQLLLGIAIGWLILPQPEWVQKTHAKIIAWFKGKLRIG